MRTHVNAWIKLVVPVMLLCTIQAKQLIYTPDQLVELPDNLKGLKLGDEPVIDVLEDGLGGYKESHNKDLISIIHEHANFPVEGIAGLLWGLRTMRQEYVSSPIFLSGAQGDLGQSFYDKLYQNFGCYDIKDLCKASELGIRALLLDKKISEQFLVDGTDFSYDDNFINMERPEYKNYPFRGFWSHKIGQYEFGEDDWNRSSYGVNYYTLLRNISINFDVLHHTKLWAQRRVDGYIGKKYTKANIKALMRGKIHFPKLSNYSKWRIAQRALKLVKKM